MDVGRGDVETVHRCAEASAGRRDGLERGVDGVEGGADDCNFDGDTVDTGVAVGGVPGFICGDLTARKIIAAYGLKPLPLAATDPTNGALGQSYCRLNKAL